jgi:hypothetical protein
MLQVNFSCQIGEVIIFVSGERSPTIIFLRGRILDQLLEYQQLSGKLNSVRDCFGHQLAEMIEKLTVRPKDFVYLDRLIKAFGRDRASAQK